MSIKSIVKEALFKHIKIDYLTFADYVNACSILFELF